MTQADMLLHSLPVIKYRDTTCPSFTAEGPRVSVMAIHHGDISLFACKKVLFLFYVRSSVIKEAIYLHALRSRALI
jgi:hypothetical protein